MKQAVEGIYSDGKVILNENVPVKGSSKVLVIFMDDYQDKAAKKERLLKTFGSWEDNRNADQIINDIYSSRTSRKEDICL
jgi:hypothetical protein